MKIVRELSVIAILILSLPVGITGCGGGGGGGGAVSSNSDNTVPVTNAGTNQNVSTGSTVTLDGSGSSDADSDALTYSWSITSVPAGSGATLSNTTVVNPTFIADLDGTYVMSLTVNDGTVDSAADTVSITAATANSAPVASSGPDQNVSTGSTVTLDGSGSSDADSDTLTYSWSITSVPSGSTAALSDETLVNPTFTADLDGSYVLSLTVNDGTVDSTADTVLITAVPKSLASNLPDTGQTKCYDNSAEITCPGVGEAFYGQDAQYLRTPMSFTDNSDGTVTDNVTGLMWQKCSAGQTNDAACSGSAMEYNWFKASGTYDATDNAASTDICGSLSLSGFTDWRLPANKELMSIVNYGTYLLPIDEAYFPNTNLSYYWVATTHANITGYAWFVDFYAGTASAYGDKQDRHFVRCVR